MAYKGICILIISFFYLVCVQAQHTSEVCQVETMVIYEKPIAENYPVSPRMDICLPVAVHIVYKDEKDNLTDEMVFAQIDQLNRDFNLLNNNLFNVPSIFKPLAAKMNIHFCLVDIDPDGNETNGISRTITEFDHIGSEIGAEGRKSIHYNQLGGVAPWFMDEVINVWVGQMESVIGFATFPNKAPFPQEDGIIIDSDFFSPINTNKSSGTISKGHTLTHEMGHFLNLNHIWADRDDGCNIDDGIADTPLQSMPYFGCPTHPQMSCNSLDMFMNFMDFTNDQCVAFFTDGQRQRMIETLMNSRWSLMSSTISRKTPSSITDSSLDQININYLPECNQMDIQGFELSSELSEVTIFTVDGRLIHQSTFMNQYNYQVFLPSNSAGILFVSITNKNDRKTIKLFTF